MNLSFPSNDPFDGIIVNSVNNAPVYQTRTDGLLRHVTLPTKFIPDLGEFQPVASLHWEEISFNSPYIVYRGRKFVMSDFLRRKGIFSKRRVFHAVDNRQYEWKPNNSKNLVLYDVSENVVAKTHKEHFGIFHKARDYNIEILSPGIPILDDIIVSFIIMYQRQKVERKRADSATGMMADSAAGMTAAQPPVT